MIKAKLECLPQRALRKKLYGNSLVMHEDYLVLVAFVATPINFIVNSMTRLQASRFE